jgi:hypothetical protein
MELFIHENLVWLTVEFGGPLIFSVGMLDVVMHNEGAQHGAWHA